MIKTKVDFPLTQELVLSSAVVELINLLDIIVSKSSPELPAKPSPGPAFCYDSGQVVANREQVAVVVH